VREGGRERKTGREGGREQNKRKQTSETRYNVNRLDRKISSPALWNRVPAIAKELSKGRGAVGGDGRTLSGCRNRMPNVLKVGPLPGKLPRFHFPHEHGERVDVNALRAPLVAVRFRRHVSASVRKESSEFPPICHSFQSHTPWKHPGFRGHASQPRIIKYRMEEFNHV
jgi:hypothetical protein